MREKKFIRFKRCHLLKASNDVVTLLIEKSRDCAVAAAEIAHL